MNNLLEAKDLHRTYTQGSRSLAVLKGASLTLKKGEIVALVGESGSGKSTLLHSIGLLDKPTSGEVMIDGKATSSLNDDERTRMRRERIGFIYQFHQLLPEFTARENIMLPLMIAGKSRQQASERADMLLGEMGLSARAAHRPAELSGGEQQRVAVARAFANSPALVLADEPTGNLDPGTAHQVFEWFLALCRAQGVSLLMATHNPQLAARADRIAKMKEGSLVFVEKL